MPREKRKPISRDHRRIAALNEHLDPPKSEAQIRLENLAEKVRKDQDARFSPLDFLMAKSDPILSTTREKKKKC